MATIKTIADFKKSLNSKAVENLFDSETHTIAAGLLHKLNAEYDSTKGRYRVNMDDDKSLTILSKVEFDEDTDISLIVLSFRRDVENYKGKQGLNFKAGSSFIIATAK